MYTFSILSTSTVSHLRKLILDPHFVSYNDLSQLIILQNSVYTRDILVSAGRQSYW